MYERSKAEHNALKPMVQQRQAEVVNAEEAANAARARLECVIYRRRARPGPWMRLCDARWAGYRLPHEPLPVGPCGRPSSSSDLRQRVQEAHTQKENLVREFREANSLAERAQQQITKEVRSDVSTGRGRGATRSRRP